MNVELKERPTTAAKAEATVQIVDCDVHIVPRVPSDISQFLPAQWKKHHDEFGMLGKVAIRNVVDYPRTTPGGGQRADSWPDGGGPPGSDLKMLQEQLLETYNVSHGMLMPLGAGSTERNPGFAGPLCTAINEWLLAYWSDPEPRLKPGIVIPADQPDVAIAEVERCVKTGKFTHVMIGPRLAEPMGYPKYRRLLQAIAHYDLPVVCHLGGDQTRPSTASGWPSYYYEEHFAYAQTKEYLIESLVFSGIFEEIPKLRYALVEGGMAWMPALTWRMDKVFNRMRDEVPHLKRLPSEYIRDHFWLTTQPIEEPPVKTDLLTLFDWIGWDRVMFSSDYPHWDHDDPRYAFRVRLPEDKRRMILRENAMNFYRLQ